MWESHIQNAPAQAHHPFHVRIGKKLYPCYSFCGNDGFQERPYAAVYPAVIENVDCPNDVGIMRAEEVVEEWDPGIVEFGELESG